MRVGGIVLVVFAMTTAFAFADPVVTPGSPEATRQAQNHYKQGKAFLDQQLYDDAIVELEKAYSLAPIPELLFNMAQAYRLKGDADKALDLYRRFVDAAPEDPLADEARTHIAYLTKAAEQKADADRRAKAEQDRLAAEAEARRQAEAAAAIESERVRVEAEREYRERKLHADAVAAAQRVEAERARELNAWNEDREARARLRHRGEVLAGAGVGLTALMTVFAVLGSDENSQIKKGGLATGADIANAASTGGDYNDAAYACLVLGVVGLAVGVPLVVTHLDRGELHVTPTASNGAAGVSLAGAF
jgi:tetratricopeptide (TPR) repeat protein